MKRLFSILAMAGLFVAVTNTVSAKVTAAVIVFCKMRLLKRKKALLKC